jgi:type II secretory pathway pseudopilin PulG
MLELLATIAIIFVLAGLLLGGAHMAQRAARVRRTEATINTLAAACEEYWATYRDYPYWWYEGQTDTTGLSADADFRTKYLDGSDWDYEAINVAFCWFMSKDRVPSPFLSLDQTWFKQVGGLRSPKDNRYLYRVVDGFDKAIHILRPTQYYVQRTYVRFISEGPDGELGDDGPDGIWGTEDDTEPAKDNIVTELRR